MQGTAMIFGAQTSTYFLRLMTLYLSHSLLLGDTGEKETSLKNTRGHGGWIRINVQLMEIRFLITLKAMMTIPCSLKLCTVNVCPAKRPLQHHRPYVLMKKKQWSPNLIWSHNNNNNKLFISPLFWDKFMKLMNVWYLKIGTKKKKCVALLMNTIIAH